MQHRQIIKLDGPRGDRPVDALTGPLRGQTRAALAANAVCPLRVFADGPQGASIDALAACVQPPASTAS